MERSEIRGGRGAEALIPDYGTAKWRSLHPGYLRQVETGSH
jgi:hypothetical protein